MDNGFEGFKEGFESFFSLGKKSSIKGIKFKHVLLGLVFVLSLTLFLHHQEVRVEHLELNQVVEKGILAEVSFSFPDVEATSMLRQEAMCDVGIIGHLDPKHIFHINKEIEDELSGNPSWRDKLPEATFDDVYSCKESIQKVLHKIHFVDERTFRKMEELQLPREGYLVFAPKNFQEEFFLPSKVWEEMRSLTLFSTPSVYAYVSQLFGEKKWTFQADLAARNRIRQDVKDSVSRKKTPVEAGTWMIQPGEKVTKRHIDMMREMKKALMEEKNRVTLGTIMGSFFEALIFTTLIILYLRMQNLEVLKSFRRIALLATIIILSLILSKVTEFVILNKAGSFVDIFCYPIVILFGTLLSCLLLDVRISFIVSVFLSVVLGITLAVKYDYFLVMNLTASLVGILSVRKIRRRKEIFEVCAKVWLAAIPVIVAFNFFQNNFWTFHLVGELFAAFIFISLTAIIVVALLPILEVGFDVVTDMTLMEYIDPNHPLLHRLSREAPGTYQHSCVLGVIAEAAAQAISANGLFCRVAALYHDIGKLSNPQYFTENQMDHINLHHLITPFESAQVIRAHVSDGISLGRQYGLPQNLIDIIQEHHGTSTIYFFYHKEVERVGSVELVDISSFRYTGPKPRTKESAIIMISDCIEAAFSSLTLADEPILQSLIENIVGEKIQDRQLDECKLTFEELGIIKRSLLKSLLVISHSRLKYPEKKHVPPSVSIGGMVHI